MATWSAQASNDLSSFKTQSTCTNAELDTLRKSVGSWADVVGKLKRKRFTVRNYVVTATAEQHVVLGLLMDM